MQHDERGERLRLLEADESVYLYPERARMPLDSALTVGEHDLPDVILEVDITTDVRRGKLALYESWGFPEVWVEVPEVQTPGRPRGLVRGLTINAGSTAVAYRDGSRRAGRFRGGGRRRSTRR